MANRCTGSAEAPVLTGTTTPPASEFGAVLERAVMTPAGLARLLRAHGWRISRGTARAWAEGGSGTKRPSPPAELLEWLRGVAAHVRRDPLPALAPAEVRSPRGRPAPAALVDWLRRLVAYHHRNPPPPPPLAAHWAEGPRTGRLH